MIEISASQQKGRRPVATIGGTTGTEQLHQTHREGER
jgi:hypothetical protein